MIRTLLLSVLLAVPCWAAAQFDVAGRRVTVDTDRYRVVVDGLTITHIHNKLTGEDYASPQELPEASLSLEKLLAERGVQVESLRPAVPLKRFGLGEKTDVQSRRDGDSVTVTYTGLQYGSGEEAEFDDDMTITLELRVERGTGDLVITPSVKGNIEQVIGVRDRGVLRNSLHVLGLAGELRIVLPAMEGVAFTLDDVNPLWHKQPWAFRWPRVWEAALLVAESELGCLGIWADEPELNYGRHLTFAPTALGWNAALEYETTDLIYQCDAISGASWRLNVFDGYWIEPARRYQQQMIEQWNMKTVDQSTPSWADKVRVAYSHMSPNPQGADQIPRDTAIVFASQGWMKGWREGEMQKRGGDYFPNWPLDNPVRYEAMDGWAQQAAALEEAGLHVFPYTNATIIRSDHPWIKEKIHDRHFHSWRIWQRFYPEQCLDIVQRYGVSGIYEDCSHVLGRHHNISPDGENWYQGSVRTREYFHQLMPDVAICGEGNSEVTARGQLFALTTAAYPEQAHPIGSFIFEPFVRIWNLQPSAATMDADDTRGLLTTWPVFPLHPYHYDAVIMKRGVIFANEQLRSHWPERWDPNVMHYFKGKDGSEYRFVRDHGTRFVKLTPDGEPENAQTIYWRLRGAAQVDAPGVGIAGWIGYDGERIIGLNPHAPLYVTMTDVERPPVVITSLPEGFAIHRHVVRDGYWVATLNLADNLTKPAKPDAPESEQWGDEERAVRAIRVRGDRAVQFLGYKSVKEIAPGEYELEVPLPGAFAAYWSEPEAVSPGHVFANVLSNLTAHDRHSGVLCREYDEAELVRLPSCQTPEQETTSTWLLRLPDEPVRFSFKYGTTHGYGDGANYMVRVNGRELWKMRRLQQDPAKPDERVAPPIAADAVDLSAYAGQTIVFELAGNGHSSGGSETRSWSQPRLEQP